MEPHYLPVAGAHHFLGNFLKTKHDNMDMQISKVYLVGIHRYSFRQGQMAEVLTVRWVTPEGREARLCYEALWSDGTIDWIHVFVPDAHGAWTLPNPDIVVGSQAMVMKYVGQEAAR